MLYTRDSSLLCNHTLSDSCIMPLVALDFDIPRILLNNKSKLIPIIDHIHRTNFVIVSNNVPCPGNTGDYSQADHWEDFNWSLCGPPIKQSTHIVFTSFCLTVVEIGLPRNAHLFSKITRQKGIFIEWCRIEAKGLHKRIGISNIKLSFYARIKGTSDTLFERSSELNHLEILWCRELEVQQANLF